MLRWQSLTLSDDRRNGLRFSRSLPIRSLSPAIMAVVGCMVGCSPAWHVSDADREVNQVLQSYNSEILGNREQWVQHPIPTPTSTDTTEQTTGLANQDAATDVPEAMVLDLVKSLHLAFTTGRDYLDQKEGLYLRGLDLTLTRYDFGPILNSTVSYIWNNAEDEQSSDTQTISLGASDILPTGGLLSLSSTLDGTRSNDPEFLDRNGAFLYDSSVQLSLSQPLLRGAGYEVSHNGLTQNVRNLIDSVRSFELFRQDFSISIANAYYGLVSQNTRLTNDEQNYQDAVFDRKKAEALRQVDRNQDDDVFLARRREIEAEDALLVSRTDYELALDDFKILLGLPTATPLTIVDSEPEFIPVRIEATSAVEAAHHNRLDLHIERDRLLDSQRHVRVARNGLLPDLDMSVDFGLSDETAAPISNIAPSRWSTSVGFSLELPLDRKAERNSYRSSLISLDQSRRNLQRRLDEIERDVLNQLRELGQVEKRFQLQKDQIEREQRAVAVTKIRYESGDADNRDLLDARQGLTDAQNALIDLRVRHFIAGLRLRRTLGILFIDDQGMWRS